MFELSCESLATKGYTGRDYYRIRPDPSVFPDYMVVICDLDLDPAQTYVYPLPRPPHMWEYPITADNLSHLIQFYDYCEQVGQIKLYLAHYILEYLLKCASVVPE